MLILPINLPKRDCVKARDPHCFWNQLDDFSQGECKVLSNRDMYDPQT